MNSILEERFSLRDLLDMSVLREVCEAYVKAFDLGIAVINESNEEIINICPPYDFCKAIQSAEIKAKCGDARKKLVRQPIEGSQVLQLKSGCGMRYALFLLSYQLESLGRVIVGPFRDPETAPEQILRVLGEDMKNKAGADKVARIPAMSTERLKSAVSLISKVLNAFLFINAKRLITTRLHLETIYASREQIFKQVELQHSGSEEDRAEIEKFKNMF
jgi:ligand-binding sensor protein